MDKQGTLHVVEVKTGPNAGLTPNQKFTIPEMRKGTPISPFGGNAMDFFVCLLKLICQNILQITRLILSK